MLFVTITHEVHHRMQRWQHTKRVNLGISLTPLIYMFVDFAFLDIDECMENLDNCQGDSLCENTQGSYNCNCNPGFEADAMGICQGKLDFEFDICG